MSDKNFSIIHISNDGLGLGKAGKALVDKVAAACGAVWGRDAKADAKVARVDAVPAEVAPAENNELTNRAARRAEGEQVREQKNIESIVAQAAKLLPPNTPEETVRDMDEDKVAAMLNMFKTVSNEEMQSLWAQIMAGEAKQPGAFSKKTFALVATMSKEDALMFADFCQFVWNIGGIVPLVYNRHHAIYKCGHRHTHEFLTHLEWLELVSIDFSSANCKTPSLPSVRGRYHSKTVVINGLKQVNMGGVEQYVLPTGDVTLTKSGEELFFISNPEPNEEFFQYVLKKWRADGLDVKETSL